jgi:alpha-tubulin suppressor-like RCC1 family protein
MTISSSSCGIWKLNEVYNKVRGNYWPQENASGSYLGETYFTGCNRFGLDGSSDATAGSGSAVRTRLTGSAGNCWILAKVITTDYAGAASGTAYTARIRCDGTLWMNGGNTEGQLGQNNLTNYSSPVQIPGTNWCDVHISNASTLAIKTDGTLWGWGTNIGGVLGTNNRTQYSSPVQIPGTQWCRVFSSRTNSCSDSASSGAVKTDGTLWVWGNNVGGSLGQNNTTQYSSPVQIPGTQWVDGDAVQYSNYNVILFLKSDGTVWVTGLQVAEFFRETTASVSSPVQIPGSQWVDACITLGGNQNPKGAGIILKSADGKLYGLGCNSAASSRPIFACGTDFSALRNPVLISDFPHVKFSASTCGNVLAIRSDGTLWAWGGNDAGQLGLGDQITATFAKQVDNSPNWIDVSTGGLSTVAVKKVETLSTRNDPNYNETTSGADLYVFGAQKDTYSSGALGLNSTCFGCFLPERLPGSWCKIAFGGDMNGDVYVYAAGIKTNNTLWTWGKNIVGVLGQINTIHRSSPVQIPGTQWCCVATGAECAMMALKTDGTLWAWGRNESTNFGQLGLNLTPETYSSPIQIPGTQWCTVSFGCFGAKAIRTDGTLWSWGCNTDGTVGDGTRIHRSSPVQIPGTSWCSVHTFKRHVAALKTDGTLWVWGAGNIGILGQNNTISSSSPVQVPGTQWCKVKTGYDHIVALKCDNTLWVWGDNCYGSLGLNNITHYSSPVQIPGTQWKNIAVTERGVFASTGEAIFAWGCNDAVQLGFFPTSTAGTGVSSPTQIPGTQWFKLMDESKNFISAAYKIQKPL